MLTHLFLVVFGIVFIGLIISDIYKFFVKKTYSTVQGEVEYLQFDEEGMHLVFSDGRFWDWSNWFDIVVEVGDFIEVVYCNESLEVKTVEVLEN